MRFREYLEKVKKWLASDELEIVYKLLAVITAMCLVFAFALTRNYNKKPEIYDITVQVKGEVNSPGVYTLKSNCRINSLVDMAGGFTDNADVDNVNLAERIIDGEIIFIPRRADGTNPNLININTADAAALDRLEGIGPAIAKRIVEYRNKYGKFTKPEHLMNVVGIGESLFNSIRALITI